MDSGILLLRLVVGLSMAAHASQKLFGWFGGYGLATTGQVMEALGFRPGRRHALAAGVVELGGGLLFASGLATPLAAALIASVMLVAAATVHWKNGFFAQNGGYELNLLFGAVAIGVAFTGPGVLSIDALLGSVPAGLAWGLGATVVAVLGAIGQLAQRQVAETPASAATTSSAH